MLSQKELKPFLSYLRGYLPARFSLFIVILWYPFTHLYSYHVAVGHIPAFMDHRFGLISILSLVLLFILFLLGAFKKVNGYSDIISLLFFVYSFFAGGMIFYYRFIGGGPQAAPELFNYYAPIIATSILLFGIGYFFQPLRWHKIIVISFLLILLNTFIFTRWDLLRLDLRSVVDPSLSAIYLALSVTALLCGLFCWSVLKHWLLKVLALGALLFMLFVIGSRADFWLLVLLSPVMLYLSIEEKKKLYQVFAVILFSMVSLIFLNLDRLSNFESRQLIILSGTADPSAVERLEQFQWGFERLSATPFWGDYGGTFIIKESIGSYMHNLFSVWQAFGLIPFLCYAALTIITAFLALKLLKKRDLIVDGHTQLIVILSLMAVLQVLFARSLAWVHIALVWGMLASMPRLNEADLKGQTIR